MKYTRKFVSFSGKCPFNCNHCYTFCSGYNSYEAGDTVDGIIRSLENYHFDILYVSGHKENFVKPDEGIRLCEEAFSSFKCDILITTRCVFNDLQLERLSILNKRMKEAGKDLFFCASIPALDSYKKLEPNPIIPSPERRIDNFIRVSEIGIWTILTLRPLCPKEFIPIEESIRIIDKCKCHITAVLSSGIVVNKQILSRMPGFPDNFKYDHRQLMPCLKNSMEMQYVDVCNELEIIKRKCLEDGLPFFTHSLPAIEYIKGYPLEYELDS